MATLALHKSYSFNVYPVAFIGDNYKNVTLLGIVDWQTVSLHGVDVPALAANCFTRLPVGHTTDDYTQYEYLKLKMPNGTTTFVAKEWIRLDTLEERDVKTAVVTIPEVSPGDAANIRAALADNGYTGISIEFK